MRILLTEHSVLRTTSLNEAIESVARQIFVIDPSADIDIRVRVVGEVRTVTVLQIEARCP